MPEILGDKGEPYRRLYRPVRHRGGVNELVIDSPDGERHYIATCECGWTDPTAYKESGTPRALAREHERKATAVASN